VSPADPPTRRHAPALEHVRVADVMHPGIVACTADTPLRDVARIMAEHRIHCVAIVDVEGAGAGAWGIVSDLDLVGAAAAGGVDAPTAGDVAAREARTISDDDVVERAVQLMSEDQVAHLVVVGAATGRPVGVLSTLDVAGLLAWHEDG
jgi:CBS domain-containing protein